MHSGGVVHRDVKPENILLDWRCHPRIGDLGFAKVDAGREATDTVGTPQYMAPETITEETVGLPGDVYAYSIMFWEIVTEKRWMSPLPFRGKKPFYDAVVKGDPKTGRLLRPPLEEVPLPAHRVLLEPMWEAIPTKRPTFQEIVQVLEQGHNWLPGTVRKDFLNYIARLNNEAERIPPEATRVFGQLLRQVPSARELVERLNDPTLYVDNDDSKTKVIQSMGIVCGTADEPNVEVMRAVGESLRRYGVLVPAEINRPAAQPVNPSEDMEFSPAE